MKKLIPALAIASYTANDNNDAIAPGVNDFKSAASAVWSNKTGDVEPTSADDGIWHTAKATNVDNYAATSYTPNSSATGLYQKTKWQIKSLAETGSVSVAVNSITVAVDEGDTVSSANLNNAIRVALNVTKYTVGQDGTKSVASSEWFYFAPNRTTGTYTYIGSDSKVATYGAQDKNELSLGTAPGKVIATGVDTNPIDVDAYVYYEGQDESCTSANAVNIDNLNVTIVYGVPANNG